MEQIDVIMSDGDPGTPPNQPRTPIPPLEDDDDDEIEEEEEDDDDEGKKYRYFVTNLVIRI